MDARCYQDNGEVTQVAGKGRALPGWGLPFFIFSKSTPTDDRATVILILQSAYGGLSLLRMEWRKYVHK
jgi:hypothetical protein